MTHPARRILAPIVVALTLGMPAGAQLFTIGFDSVGAPGAFQQIFPGLANGPHLEILQVTLDGGVILNDALFANSATSGDNILATCDTCGLGDGPPPTGLPGSITGVLGTVADSLELDVINGSTAQGGNFTLTAFGPSGAVVATDTVFAGVMGSASQVQHLSVTAPAIRSFVVTTELGVGYTFAIDTLSGHHVQGDWANLGNALAGTNGEPVATGEGSLVGGDPTTLRLTSALENASVAVIAGSTQVNAPFYGGVFVPNPDIILFFPTDGAGELQGTAAWPENVPSGAPTFFQFWVFDAGGPFGFAASNALRATAP
jgi:hypothetical protein